MRLGFIGGGVMAEAIIAGIREASLRADITVGEPLEERRDGLVERYMVLATAQNAEAVEDAEIVVLAVKPQQFDRAAAELADLLTPEQTVLSIMAGVKIHSLGLKLKHGRIIRVMPNMPAQIGSAMSVWTAWGDVPEETVKFTGEMLDAIGEQLYLEDEKLVDVATAVSASGPAYVFTFMESLTDAGVQLGMPHDAARLLALRTTLGSAELAIRSGKHPAELRNMVTSPGGTTAAALRALEKGGLRAAVLDAVNAAHERGEELGAGTK